MTKTFLILAFLIVATPSFASEVWNCDFASTSGSDKGLSGIAKIQIDKDTLDWQLPVPVKSGMEWTTSPHRLLENNDLGTVAASSQSYSDSDVGPVIGARVIVLNKSNGDLRIGSVMIIGEHDFLTGHCKRE
jgi:hypothetical protein